MIEQISPKICDCKESFESFWLQIRGQKYWAEFYVLQAKAQVKEYNIARSQSCNQVSLWTEACTSIAALFF